MKKVIRTNKIVSLVQLSLTVICTMVSGGTLLQTLLVTLGFSTKLIYIHSTFIQAVNVAALLLCAKITDKSNTIKRYALTGLPSGILLLCYLPFCFRSSASFGAFILILLIGMFQGIITALRTNYSYTLPYLLYPAEDYGFVTAISGIISGVLSFLIGYTISIFSRNIPYVILMAGAFSLCALLEFISIRLTLLQKSILSAPIYNDNATAKNTPQISRTIKHPAFSRLILPNILRGFATGAVGVLAAVAFELGYDETVTTVMVSLSSVAALVGCTAFGFLLKWISAKILVFIGSISFLLLPFLFTQNKTLFLLVYTIVLFGKAWIDYGVPTFLRYEVPMDIAGSYNVLRMLLHSGGGLIATSIATLVSSKVLILLTVTASVISGCCYLLNTIPKSDN